MDRTEEYMRKLVQCAKGLIEDIAELEYLLNADLGSATIGDIDDAMMYIGGSVRILKGYYDKLYDAYEEETDFLRG